MRRPLVAGNWKLHGTQARVLELIDALLPGVEKVGQTDWAICPTFVHLPLAVERTSGSTLAVGGQDVSEEREGAFTGEVAAPMLVETGCRYAIVGHSERRARHGETDFRVAAKFAAANAAGLTPILCIGETLEQRDAGDAAEVVERQLRAVLDHVGADGFADGVVAYEPVWAIGTGRTATPEQAQEIHGVIRRVLGAAGGGLEARCRVLYGGSVKAANAAALFAQPDIDGALVGGASLDADEFLAIGRAAAARAGD